MRARVEEGKQKGRREKTHQKNAVLKKTMGLPRDTVGRPVVGPALGLSGNFVGADAGLAVVG